MAKCPHCEKPVVLKASRSDKTPEVCRETRGSVKKEIMYFCPHCDKILGFGFFPGGILTGRP